MTLDEGAVEVAIYFLLLLVTMMLMLDRLRGKYGNMNNWLLTRRLEVFKGDAHNSSRVVSYLTAACVFYICLPILVLLGWVALLAYSAKQEGESLLGPLCLLILGLAAICLCVGILKIKWNNFRFKKVNFVLLVAALALITFYQALVIFGYEHDEKFFPQSAFFLNFNVVILSVLVYLAPFNKAGDLATLLKTSFPKTGVEIDPNRQVDMQ